MKLLVQCKPSRDPQQCARCQCSANMDKMCQLKCKFCVFLTDSVVSHPIIFCKMLWWVSIMNWEWIRKGNGMFWDALLLSSSSLKSEILHVKCLYWYVFTRYVQALEVYLVLGVSFDTLKFIMSILFLFITKTTKSGKLKTLRMSHFVSYVHLFMHGHILSVASEIH